MLPIFIRITPVSVSNIGTGWRYNIQEDQYINTDHLIRFTVREKGADDALNPIRSIVYVREGNEKVRYNVIQTPQDIQRLIHTAYHELKSTTFNQR